MANDQRRNSDSFKYNDKTPVRSNKQMRDTNLVNLDKTPRVEDTSKSRATPSG